MVFSLRTMGQEVTDEYKDYKPCKECLDKWTNTTNSDYAPTGSHLHKTNNSLGEGLRNQSRKVGQFCAVIIGGIVTVFIYKKLDNEINKTN